jgi:hypothetical protein
MFKYSTKSYNVFIPRLSRGVRTRTPIKLKIQSKNHEKINEKNVEIEIEIDKDNNNDININGKKELLLKRSKFSKFDNSKNDEISKIIKQLNFKNPEYIKNELIERFKNDGIDIDNEFIDRMIEQSEKEQEILKNYLNDPNKTVSTLNNDEINNYVDWIINDSYNRLNTQSHDKFKEKVKLREKLNEFIMDSSNSSNPDPESMTEAFIMAQEISKLNSENSLDKLPIFLKHLNKLNNIEIQNLISLEKYSKLYEISTQLIDEKIRDKCIYLCGKLLYKSLIKEFGLNARPDPINEKFYIESCIKFNDLDKAFYLFNSRREKDVKDERFWFELGVSIHLAQYSNGSSDSLDIAIDLIHNIRDKWGYVNNLILIDGLKRCCLKKNFDDAWWFWEDIELNINELGIIKRIEIPETKLYEDNEKDQVFNYYNRIEPIFYDGIIECIFSFIGETQFDKAIEILNRIVQIDNEFIYYFIKLFIKQFRYSGRELFLIHLENDQKNSNIYIPEIRDYLIDEIKPSQKTRCSSFEEAKIIEEINIYLERLTNLRNKNWTKVNDLKEIIQSGEKLTSFDIKSLLKILLEHKSTTSYDLACKIIHQMNQHKLNNITNSILPIANSYAYIEFCDQFLSQSNPRVNEINQFLNMMMKYNIKLDQTLANKIIMSYVSKNLYTEAIKFIETYIFTNNPIAVNEIKLGNPGSKNLYTTVLIAYYKSIVTGCLSTDLIELRLTSLHYFIKQMMEHKVDDNFTLQETIGTLLAYGDYKGLICLIQWYGDVLGCKTLNFNLVLAIKSKLELSISKAEKYLKLQNKKQTSNHGYELRIQDYRENFGIQSLQQDLKTKREITWQEVAQGLYKYADLFGYRSVYDKDDPFAILISDRERFANKDRFDEQLIQLQDYYNLPNWKL